MILPRIFFDTNSGTPSRQYGLWFDQSKRDLALIPGGPQEGMRVTIYMTDEVEMQATLSFDHETKSWVANPIPETIVLF
jgi:hypothetical protein